MRFFKELFGQVSGAASNVALGQLAQDMSRPEADRARDIADAVNRTKTFDLYLQFRDAQMAAVGEKSPAWQKATTAVDYLRDRDDAHTQYVQKLVAAGKVLITTTKMRDAAADFGRMRNDVQKLVQATLDDMERMKDLFRVMIEAEKQMPLLPDAQKKSLPFALALLGQEADGIRLNGNRIPPENKDAEKAIDHARNADIARDRQQREAVAEAEARGRRVKLNEYLKTGCVTGAAIKAPKTARFTRKAKPAQGVAA